METAALPFGEVRYADLAATDTPRAWLWHGLIGPGLFTLLTSPAKHGKTTLLAALIAKRRAAELPRSAGGEAANPPAAPSAVTLAGLAVAPGLSAVASEEPAHLWHERGRSLPFRDDTVFFCRPFPGKPTVDQLARLCGRMRELKDTRGLDLAVFDPLVHFLPRGAENSPDLLIEALAPIRQLTSAGLAVVALHHPSKGATRAGQSARGTGALTGDADIALELSLVNPHDRNDRRRHLTAWSRWPQTPPALLLELTADASDYEVLGAPDEALSGFWPGLCAVLEDARGRLNRRDILRDWPGDHPAPSAITLMRLLDTVVARGLVCRDGAGRKRDPYRYWLPAKVAEFENDILCIIDEQHRAALRTMTPEQRRLFERPEDEG